MLKQCNRLVLAVLVVAAVSSSAACGNGGEEVTVEDSYPDMPRVCDLVPRSTVDGLVHPTALPGGEGTGETATCTWSYQPSETPEGTERQPYRRELEVAVTRYEAMGERPGAYWAERTFEQLGDEPGMGPSEDLSGIGEQAYQWFGRYGVDEAGIEFVKANLTVRVTYGGDDVTADGESVEMDKAMAIAGARTAAEEVDHTLTRLR